MNKDIENNVINREPSLNLLSFITFFLIGLNDRYLLDLDEDIYRIMNYAIPFISSGIFYFIKVLSAKYMLSPKEILFLAHTRRNIKEANKMIEDVINNPEKYSAGFLEEIKKRREELLLASINIKIDEDGELTIPILHTE